MTIVAAITTALLWAAIEDVHGLWEYPGEAEGASAGQFQGQASQRIASAVLTALLADGLVSFYWCREPEGVLEEIPAVLSLEKVNEATSWVVPQYGERFIGVGSTVTGEEAYLRLITPYEGPPLTPLR